MSVFAAIWVTLFAILLTFVVGVIVWAVAGPALAIAIFVVAVVLFVWLPWKARNAKTPPHPRG